MTETCSNEAEAEITTEEIEKVESEKEELSQSNGDDDRLSQLGDEESLVITDPVMQESEDESVRETLTKDLDENNGVREKSSEKPNSENPGEVKELDEVAALSDSSTVKPSLSSDPSASQALSLISLPTNQEQQGSDPHVVTNLSVSPVLRTPPLRDGYNWRKYGQKQVKSPKGSRSYYRCTYSDCCAKKIECSNDSGNMIEIVNKGSHSHEPLRKYDFSPREIRAISTIPPPHVPKDNTLVQEELAIVPTSGSVPSASSKDFGSNVCERKRHCENEAVEEPEQKRRQKNDNSQSSDSVSKHGKKHRVVVNAAGEVGISGDGYRWRKYGQKMVKGNPNPRNYYRCTSAGCPVRKHIETAVENSSAVIITYKGVHNHDTPVPKKRHGPPSSVLVAAAAPTSMRTTTSRQDDHQVNIATSSEKKQGSEALDVGGEKAMESARTLLSIGFEIKQC